MLASSNPGKLRELEALLAPLGMEVLTQSSLGVADAEEPHVTFVENALAKARHASRYTGLAALADDSGLCVAALGGEPGVHSARLAGEPPPGAAAGRAAQDARNNERLVRLLADKDDRSRGLASGARDYVIKPFKLDELLTVVRKHLGAGAPE